MLKSTFSWLFFAVIVRVASPSQITKSASLPTSILPFCGRLKTLAAFVLVTATNLHGSIKPDI
uniref:Secreted protein n=1 Tax=Schistosoma curassoni TaxID=6186 RepID=A0A183JMK8_9TREM